ncbi:type I-E CRISPR-associated protein Cas5/CasD [Microbulbifer thermotolerans]|uniref:Type I-E CRISPR-associated protein Cas5/CasD n=1 Tax=Microbulbifer thermotolerans TaxID=252514 RepID=A0AB35HX08_MICTH|nr:type I-E CRISPR-associated protein Cas5/CasD [Microbulbifer thermotolerans]MCX2793353.1 type I-E CRISPR-associated protein Cas5/CasD [Microbulbifer thermotolerans]MCX2801292.1 type I-E CRISPR-associated protein Cas5/CasD [Microbulbifer thermotolerans]
MEALIFQLYGPLASWGAPAVGETRPSADHPGRAALLGLLAAALGIRRDDGPNQQALAASVRFAVKQHSAGRLMRDYHTVQVPGRDKKARYFTRKDELSVPKEKLNTVLSSREYRQDGLWQVAVLLNEQSDWNLDELEAALRAPVFTPYLGRKACPLAVPMAPQKVQAKGLREVFAAVPSRICDQQARWLNLPESVDYYWEGDAGDIEVQDTRQLTDDLISRDRWQFGSRREHHARLREEA